MCLLCFYPVIFETEVIDLGPVLRMEHVTALVTPLLSQEHQWLQDWEVFRLATLGSVAQEPGAEASWRSNITAELSHARFASEVSAFEFHPTFYVTNCGAIL